MPRGFVSWRVLLLTSLLRRAAHFPVDAAPPLPPPAPLLCTDLLFVPGVTGKKKCKASCLAEATCVCHRYCAQPEEGSCFFGRAATASAPGSRVTGGEGDCVSRFRPPRAPPALPPSPLSPYTLPFVVSFRFVANNRLLFNNEQAYVSDARAVVREILGMRWDDVPLRLSQVGVVWDPSEQGATYRLHFTEVSGVVPSKMEELVSNREFKDRIEEGVLRRVGKVPSPPLPPAFPPSSLPSGRGSPGGNELGEDFWTFVLIASSAGLLTIVLFFAYAPVERLRAFVGLFRAILSRSAEAGAPALSTWASTVTDRAASERREEQRERREAEKRQEDDARYDAP